MIYLSQLIPLTMVSYPPPSKTTEVSNIQSIRPPFGYLSTAAANILRDVEDPGRAGHTIRISFSVIGHPIKRRNGVKECTKNMMHFHSSLGCFFKIIKTIQSGSTLREVNCSVYPAKNNLYRYSKLVHILKTPRVYRG